MCLWQIMFDGKAGIESPRHMAVRNGMEENYAWMSHLWL